MKNLLAAAAVVAAVLGAGAYLGNSLNHAVSGFTSAVAVANR